MSFRVVLDVTTRGLLEARSNVREVNNLITMATADRMLRWYNRDFKKTMLRTIESGRPVSHIPRNVGRYAEYKFNRYGIDHGLGIATGGLYFGVSATQPSVKETRGKEVRLVVVFKEPYYLAFVVDGTRNHIGRNFILVSQEKELPKLIKSIGSMFDGLDFTQPHSQLVSSILGPRISPSLRGG